MWVKMAGKMKVNLEKIHVKDARVDSKREREIVKVEG